MRIGLLADREAPQGRADLLGRTVDFLRDWGADAALVVPRSGAADLAHDLYLVACDGAEALELARSVADRGGALLDAYPAVRSAHDRVATLRRLAAAGISASTAVGGRGPTHTLDFLGGQVFGVSRGARTGTRELLVTLGPELRSIALRCAPILDLTLFSLDLVVRRGRADVVGVRAFPSLRGVPDAALRLADFVYAAAERFAANESRARLPQERRPTPVGHGV